MKKLIFSAAVLASAFFAASCQQEMLDPQAEGTTVTYTVEVPDAIATKAIGDQITDVDTVYFEVYRAAEVDDLAKTPVYEGNRPVTNNVATFDLEFIKDQEFVVLFWAQNSALVKTDQNTDGMYDIDDLRAIELVNPGAANNAAAQVFAGKDTVDDCVSDANGNVTLTRPVSQINVYTTTESLTFGDVRIVLDKSSMTVAGLYNTYNVAAGDAVVADENKATFVYTDAAVPAVPADNTDLKYVAMNYVGFAPQAGATTTVDFTIKTTTEAEPIVHKVSNVPVKPNYRTNIVGDLITAKADYTVTLNDDWRTPDEVVEVVTVSTASELVNAIAEASTVVGESTNIKLEGDIDLGALIGMFATKAAVPTYGLEITAGRTLVLDLNGNTLSQTVNQTGAYSMIQNSGNLTIVDSKGTGKIAYGDTGNGGNYVSNTIGNSGKLVIESGLIENNSSAAVAANGYPHPIDNSGELIINGGTLTNNANYSSMRIWCTTDDDTSVTINGGTFNGSIDFQTPNASGNKGTITINGGTFNADTYTNSAVRLLGFGADVDEMFGYIKGGTFNGEIALRNWSGAEFNSQVFYITGGTYTADPSAFVEDDFVAVYDENAKVWNIAEAYAKVGETKYTSLNDAFKAALKLETANIVVLRDTEMGAVTVENGKTITLDLNGKTITGIDTATGSYGLITNKANLTVKGPGAIKLSATNDRNWNAYSSVISNTVGGNLTVEGGAVLEHLGGTDMAYGIDNLTNGKGTSAVTTIKDATVISTYRAVRQFLNGIEATNELYVEEGAVITGANKSIWMQDPSAKLNTGKLVVEEGAELNGDVYLFVTAGSEAWPVEVSIADSALAGESTVMAGNVPAGYEVENVGGTWKVIAWTSVSTADELVAALEAKQSVVFANDIKIDPANMSNAYGTTGINIKYGQSIDGNGKTLNIKGAGGTWDSGINTTGGLIKDLTVTGSFRGIFINHTSTYSEKVVLENVTIGDNGTVYTISCDQGLYQGIEATNCTFNGWTSFAKDAGEAKFVNCSFGEGSGYMYCRPYSNTQFVECTFCPGYEVDTTRAKVTFTDCTWEE